MACWLLAVHGYDHQDWTLPRCSRKLTALRELGVSLPWIAAELVAGMPAVLG
jgi:hypothetical protein